MQKYDVPRGNATEEEEREKNGEKEITLDDRGEEREGADDVSSRLKRKEQRERR